MFWSLSCDNIYYAFQRVNQYFYLRDGHLCLSTKEALLSLGIITFVQVTLKPFFAIQIASRGTLESLPDHSVLHVLEKLLEKRGTLDILDHSVLHVFEEVLEKKEES